MFLSGLQKLTLLDYPGKVACTVFTAGCNFRCPFCHNAGLVLPVPAFLLRSILHRTTGSVACTEIYSGEALRASIRSNS